MDRVVQLQQVLHIKPKTCLCLEPVICKLVNAHNGERWEMVVQIVIFPERI